MVITLEDEKIEIAVTDLITSEHLCMFKELERKNCVTLIFNRLPISINKYYIYPVYNKGKKVYGRLYGTPTRSPEARYWAGEIFGELNSEYNQSQVALFKQEFDASNMGIGVEIIVYYPEDKLFTKKGAISSRSMDCSNFEKPLIDVLFDKRFSTRTVPEGAPNLELNDKLILSLNSVKFPSKEAKTVVKLWSYKLDEVKKLFAPKCSMCNIQCDNPECFTRNEDKKNKEDDNGIES